MVPSFRVVALLLFGSGFSALVYQTAWQRMFRLTFGASTAASAAVLAIFLGGLGLGGALLGRRVERSRRPLMFYGNLELGISGLAALSPLLSDAVHHLYLSLGGSQALGSLGATLLRLALTAIVIGPAAVLMGGTLPAAARAVVTEGDSNRRSLALLYSLNTVGAVLGALVGPLLLFALLGNRFTLWGAACVNVLVGILARALGRRMPELASAASGPASVAVPSATSDTGRLTSQARLLHAVAALVGFVFLSLELVWYRILAPILGGSSLTFGLILACALSGIGLGGYLFSTRSPDRPATLELLSGTLALEAVAVLVPFAWGDDLAFVAGHLRGMANLGFGHLIAVWTFLAAVVVVPASIVSGYQFPLLFALLGRGRAGVGRQVGTAYAFNTIGTLTGSLLAGFVLIPALGAVTTWRVLAQVLLLATAGCAICAWRLGTRLRALAPALLAALAALALSRTAGPGSVFRHSAIGAGRFDISALSPNELIGLERSTDSSIIWQRDGVESSVAITVAKGVSFVVNGKSDGSVIGDRGTQAFLGLLPAALHGHAKTAFVVGLGTGMSAGLLGRVPGMERVDVAELEPSVLEVARRATLANGDVLNNSKVRIMNGDGRELLLTTPHLYDLILSEPSNPYRAGVASLYTREFYEAAASRLHKNGLFAQWTQGYEVDARTLSMVIRTLRAVFPYVSLWGPSGNDLILIGSLSPQVIDAERLQSDLRDPAYLTWMRRAWGTEGPEGLIAHHLAPSSVLARLAASLPAPINTDDVNEIEFAFARSVGDHRYRGFEDLFGTLKRAEYRPQVAGAVDWQLVENYRHRVHWDYYRGPEPSTKTRAVMAGCFDSLRLAATLWPTGEPARDATESWVLGMVQARNGDDDALEQAEGLRRDGFVAESLLVRARLAEARKDYDGAVGSLLAAFEQLRKTALPLCDANKRALDRALALAAKAPARAPELLQGVARGPFAVFENEFLRTRTQLQLARSLQQPLLCAEGIKALEARLDWEFMPLALRAGCLRHIGAPEAASAELDLLAFLANEPQTFQGAQASNAGSEPAASDE